MAYTRHGHHIPFTDKEEGRPSLRKREQKNNPENISVKE
jgi:hypothetical protein